MSQVEPTKATFSRDEIEKRIKESIAGDEGTYTVDLLESIDERLCETNDLLWRLVNKETHETTKSVKDYYDNKQGKPQQPTEDDYGKPLIKQEDVNRYMETVKDYYGDMDGSDFDKYAFVDGKPVTLDKQQRHIIYVALGSKVSTMRNKLGEAVYQEHDDLKNQITKHELLIAKLKNS